MLLPACVSPHASSLPPLDPLLPATEHGCRLISCALALLSVIGIVTWSRFTLMLMRVHTHHHTILPSLSHAGADNETNTSTDLFSLPAARQGHDHHVRVRDSKH